MTPAFRFDSAFENQAARSPGAVALRSREDTVTYGVLDARANRVANALRDAGVAPGAFVGLHVERSIDAVAAMLGILKAGGAVVPLPPAWPSDRVADILGFARLDLVIDADATPVPKQSHSRTLHIADALRGTAEVPPRVEGSDQPAFVICSSGSTGAPKMIVRSHASFLHRLRWTWDQHPFAPDDVCIQKSFQATTHAVYELFEPLLRGVAVRLVSDENARDLTAFWELLTAERVTRLLIVPSMLQASLDLPAFQAPPLRVLVLMGEHVPARLASSVVAAFPAATKIVSIYGSSEASSTLVSDLRASRAHDEDPPLGRPISSDIRAAVLDDDLKPVTAGRSGMLYIAGPPLFTEYFRNPEGTAAVFVEAESERRYRTGDQVLVRHDGSLAFAGRVDGVVKIRGFRVDPGDVERWLVRAPGVELGVVAPHPNNAGATLVAYVTPASVPTAPIFAWLRDHLPSYMLPSAVVALGTFPRTPSGKIDRMRLAREHHPGSETVPADYESDTERNVAAVWRDLLGVGRIERDRSFFEVGGTSLTVFAAAHRLREKFGLTSDQLNATALYASPTVARVAVTIDAVRRGDPAPARMLAETVLVPLRGGDGTGGPPLFVVAAAGGTLGAYDKTVRALRTTRDVVGLRDPFLDGARAPTEGFQRWVRRYTAAVRERQPRGPYHILAYSSAGAFGLEIAQQLRADGQDVALLALVDPVAMDYADPRRFGHWALRARFVRGPVRELIRWAGAARAAVPATLRAPRTTQNANNWTPAPAELAELVTWANTSADSMLRFAALLEMNTGRPFALTERDLAGVEPSGYLDVLIARVAQVDATIDAELIRRALVQYELQVRSQHRYRLQRYDGTVHLFEVAGPTGGLIAAQLRPYVRSLDARTVPLAGLSDRTKALLATFPETLRGHYSCMRNDAFAERLAGEISVILERPRR